MSRKREESKAPTVEVRGERVEVPENQRTAVGLDPLDPHGHKHPETNVCPEQCFRDGDQKNTV